MKSTDAPSKAALRALLHAPVTAPAQTAAALAAQRVRLAGHGQVQQELQASELRWLGQCEPDATLAAEFAATRVDWLLARVRSLAKTTPDAGVLCDLAEVQAEAVMAGEAEIVRQAGEAIAAGIARVGASSAVEQEVGERFAALSTAIDELPLAHQVQLLACSGRVVAAMGKATGSRVCRHLGRRLLRAADDRELAKRLEARIGRRGVAFVETTNFVLLLVVLTTLVLEWTLLPSLTEGQLDVLHWIDALACLFFVADFVFELALHPARWSWFLRNAVTDLVPAVPAVLILLPGNDLPGGVESVLLLRAVRLLRVTWAARYVQMLRPLLRSARLLLFLVRGLDGLVARFAQILNREFVFVPAAADIGRGVDEEDLRDLLFAALRREHELVALLPLGERAEVLRARCAVVREAAASMQLDDAPARVPTAGARDIPIADAIEFLWALRPQDVGRWLRPADISSLDRVIRVLSSVPVRWLPIIRRLAVHPLPATAEERIVQLGRRIAEWVEGWHGRMLFFADLHGIVTGPQILDRVATALVKATQRPAVRLILFGGVFSLLGLGTFSKGLLIVGAVCLGLVSLGYWLKRLAGQASAAYRLTSEAHFLSQVERDKLRFERVDTAFLAQRVFGDGDEAKQAQRLLRAQLASVRTGVPVDDPETPEWLRFEANRVALLYLHFLDGAPLHEGDVKTTEQLLANQSLVNLRERLLHTDKKTKKRLRTLRLDQGSILAGPYLWFSFITESIAVEAAKRIAGYNRYCIPLAQLDAARPEERAAMQDWLQRRRDPRGGRTLAQKLDSTALAGRYPAAEFTALDFVGGDAERDRHLAAVFGDEVLDVVRRDRRTMVREIFGTRPVHELPKHERSFNPLRFHRRRLSHGRVLLLPLLFLWRFVRSIGWLVARVRQIVREVFDPDLAMQRRVIGEAPFAVALRKIHRMKAPGLLEAIRLRLAVDPVYAGAPAGWSSGESFATEPPVERDLRFLHLREREATQLRDKAAAMRQHIVALHAALAWLPELAAEQQRGDAGGELAVTCAWIADHDHVRTLLFAERWRTEVLPELESTGQPSFAWKCANALRSVFFVPAAERWLSRHGRELGRQARHALRHAYARDLRGTRAVVDAWVRLPADASPAEHAIATLRRAHGHGGAVRRDVLALRAVQSLAVLDVRNYRDLVFRLGDYGSDGENARLGGELP